ncbi:glycosyl hydrolase family 43 protein [Pochonia chlamydosporia 170]|uniref:Glycosyl hydrolase family 43 protein n=1 Tax=Pochonia chlamydosporia 170 TaxID=1380566 RepID=A0A179F0T9_METCM|nr:glycosyl hydrolase family 43 protein [Pochonia chlamydosporia 170]OAQ58860.1 glycosyl hydrolase family 43 protein [Pochonia chlamydosporia 170]
MDIGMYTYSDFRDKLLMTILQPNTGHHVQAHGAGFIEVSGTYYMIGEDKTNGSAFQNINCYSSTNLVEWKFENALLSRTASGDLGPDRVVERPKVIYNDKTSTYVMYLHIDDSGYGEAKVGVATSSSVCGDYQYRGSFNPLGQQSRDIGLFKDDDGSGYLLTEDRPNGLRIVKLSADFLNTTANTYLWSDHFESPAVLKKDGYYFMFGSHLSGWNPNDNVYSYAKSLSGPWSSWTTFADVGSNTYWSQTNYILPFGESAIYMGDRWQPSNLMRSTYIWLPLDISGSKVTLKNRSSWVPNVKEKKWSDSPASTQIEADNATLSGGAKTVSCSGCSGGQAVGWVGGPSGGRLTFSGIQSNGNQQATVRIAYANGDETERYANVVVNGKAQKLVFLPTGGGQSAGDSSLNCELVAGSGNAIVIEGLDGAYGPDVDLVSIPEN